MSSGSIFRWEFHSLGKKGHAFVVEPHGALITNDDESMVRAALQGAVSVAGLLITTEAMVAEKPEKSPQSATPGGMASDMGF